jgi:hypothetical protein
MTIVALSGGQTGLLKLIDVESGHIRTYGEQTRGTGGIQSIKWHHVRDDGSRTFSVVRGSGVLELWELSSSWREIACMGKADANLGDDVLGSTLSIGSSSNGAFGSSSSSSKNGNKSVNRNEKSKKKGKDNSIDAAKNAWLSKGAGTSAGPLEVVYSTSGQVVAGRWNEEYSWYEQARIQVLTSLLALYAR